MKLKLIAAAGWSLAAQLGAWLTGSADPFVVFACVFAGFCMGMETEWFFAEWRCISQDKDKP